MINQQPLFAHAHASRYAQGSITSPAGPVGGHSRGPVTQPGRLRTVNGCGAPCLLKSVFWSAHFFVPTTKLNATHWPPSAMHSCWQASGVAASRSPRSTPAASYARASLTAGGSLACELKQAWRKSQRFALTEARARQIEVHEARRQLGTWLTRENVLDMPRDTGDCVRSPQQTMRGVGGLQQRPARDHHVGVKPVKEVVARHVEFRQGKLDFGLCTSAQPHFESCGEKRGLSADARDRKSESRHRAEGSARQSAGR